MSGLSNFLWSLFKKYDNINILLKRNDETYDTNGRLQGLQEAQEIDEDIKQTLDVNNISYSEFSVHNDTPLEIYRYLIEKNL
jgi:hypothetical protein